MAQIYRGVSTQGILETPSIITLARVGREVVRQHECLDIFHAWWEDVAQKIAELGSKDITSFEPKSPMEMLKARGFAGEAETRWSRTP